MEVKVIRSPDPQVSSRSVSDLHLTRSPRSRRSLVSIVMTGVTFLSAALALLPLVAILTYIVFQGARRLNLELFTELPPPPLVEGGGFGNALIGTLLTVGLGALIAIPIGVLGAIFLSEFGRDSHLAQWIDFFNNVLSGVPSIVIGVFVYGGRCCISRAKNINNLPL
jgi:phosphate transport system permease protein